MKIKKQFRPKYLFKYYIWVVNGYIGKRLSINSLKKLTVILTYYHPLRMKDINNQIRNLLKCDFVENIVVSNHNPDLTIADRIVINDRRITCVDQTTRRGCGFRWQIAKDLETCYIISIDDDILIFPSQVKTLFQHLIQEPEVPHGFSGIIRLENEGIKYLEQNNIDVDYLCEIYAVTKDHVKRYFEINRLLIEIDETFTEIIEKFHDFIIISQTGSGKPKIHKKGRIFRSETFKTAGIALHKDQEWSKSFLKVSRAVQEICNHKPN